jgi:antitoxin CptB
MGGLSKLRWQCRRGTLELDLLLSRYLEKGYPVATHHQQALFVQLLAFEDDTLLDVLITGTAHPSTQMQTLIQCIRNA